ncbi:MAG: gamma-glutamylcyclotransferase [Burkholderiales bacterium]
MESTIRSTPMIAAADPFSFHPELRDRIADPLASPSRTLTTAKLAAVSKERGLPMDWWHSDREREAERAEFLAGRRAADLWVFGYGSLMWDPALRFEEVRRAHVAGYARRFILKDIFGGRGTIDAPGLMVALDRGPGCDGLAFRIARENIEEETEVLWRRERIGPAYSPVLVEAIAADRRMMALTFVADCEAEAIDPGLTRAQQVEYCATGAGFMGTSLEYLRKIHGQFVALGIQDDEVSGLLREAEAYAASSPKRR